MDPRKVGILGFGLVFYPVFVGFTPKTATLKVKTATRLAVLGGKTATFVPKLPIGLFGQKRYYLGKRN